MKKMATIAAAVLIGTALAGRAVAQGQAPSSQPAPGQCQKHAPWGHHKGGAHGPDGVFQSLNLTPDQKTQVKSIMDRARADAQNATDPQAKHQVFQAAFEKIKTTVLTADQVKQLEAAKAGRHGGQCGKAGKNAPATVPSKT